MEERTQIKFSKDSDWGSSQVPNTHDVMSYSIFAIGLKLHAEGFIQPSINPVGGRPGEPPKISLFFQFSAL